ncbi:MAG: sulfurtransferase TusA family protein [Sporomusaceae bacterium]|jgi:TusA-related sulfurtransferase|nr:sulfurtransferase TusA family protein [Sporomusaceae bacterium]
MKTVDARGVSCPEPLLRLKAALKSEKEIILLLDDKYSLENCSRYAEREGFSTAVTNDNEEYQLQVKVK